MDLSSISSGYSSQSTSLAEMREKLFNNADADGDGTLTQEELADAIANAPEAPDGSEAPDAEELFERMDADGDGVVTQEEHDAVLEEMDAERGEPPPEPPPNSFDGSTETLQALLEALQSSDAESDGETTTDVDTLVSKLVAQMNENGTYSSSGTTKGLLISYFESSS